MRPRKKDRHLPPCVYYKHGAYYLVRAGKWVNLGRDYASAIHKYATLHSRSGTNMGALIDKALADAHERGLKANTLEQYGIAARRLKDAFAEFAVADVQPKHVGQLMDAYRKSPNFANRMRSLLKMAMDHAVRVGMRDANPVLSIERFDERQRTRYITDEEWRAIYAEASSALRCMMDIAYYTGQRIGDVLAIRLTDVSEQGVSFRQEKTDKRLLVEMSPSLSDAVERAKRLHRTRPLYLLGQRNGKIRSYRGARDLFARAASRAGIKDVGRHDIRAKSITDAKAQGLDAKALAGHSTEAQTNRYLRGKTTARVKGPSFRQSDGY